MNRPYIFCHMMTSLDGKIMGNYMETPEGAVAGDVFYNISFGKNPYYKHQGWLSGRIISHTQLQETAGSSEKCERESGVGSGARS